MSYCRCGDDSDLCVYDCGLTTVHIAWDVREAHPQLQDYPEWGKTFEHPIQALNEMLYLRTLGLKVPQYAIDMMKDVVKAQGEEG